MGRSGYSFATMTRHSSHLRFALTRPVLVLTRRESNTKKRRGARASEKVDGQVSRPPPIPPCRPVSVPSRNLPLIFSPWDAPSPAGRPSPRRTSPPRRGACPPARRALRPRSPRPPSRRRRRPPRPAWASCANRPDRPRRSGRTSAAGVSPRSYGGGGWALFPCFFVFVFIRSFFIGPPFQVPVRVIRSGFIARRGGVSFELVDGRREKGRRDGNSPGMLSSFILLRPPRKPNGGRPLSYGCDRGSRPAARSARRENLYNKRPVGSVRGRSPPVGGGRSRRLRGRVSRAGLLRSVSGPRNSSRGSVSPPSADMYWNATPSFGEAEFYGIMSRLAGLRPTCVSPVLFGGRILLVASRTGTSQKLASADPMPVPS